MSDVSTYLYVAAIHHKQHKLNQARRYQRLPAGIKAKHENRQLGPQRKAVILKNTHEVPSAPTQPMIVTLSIKRKTKVVSCSMYDRKSRQTETWRMHSREQVPHQ